MFSKFALSRIFFEKNLQNNISYNLRGEGLVNKQKKHFTASEKYLIDFIKENEEIIPSTTIVKLSELANVSTATIVRTVKKLGYSGYTSFRFNMVNNQEKHEFSIIDEVDNEIGQAILKNQIEVSRTIDVLNSDNIEDSVQIIKNTEKIMIFARGFSTFIGEEMTTKFQLLGKYCELHTDPNIIRKISTKIHTDSLMIFISLNGETIELVEAAQNNKNQNTPSILITANGDSSLAKNTDINFVGYKSSVSYFPDYEVRSRLPLQTIARILLDAYVIRTS